jgi:hypothetical protein
MMKNALFLLALLVTVLAISNCTKQSQEQAPVTSGKSADTVVWGEQVNGLQAGLSLKDTDKGPKMSVTLVLHLRNAGDKPIRILKLAANAAFWGPNLPLEVKVKDSLRKYQDLVLEPPPPAESEYIYLKPGDTDSVEVLMFFKHWNLTSSDKAEILFVYQNQLKDAKDLWTGLARSGILEVKMN